MYTLIGLIILVIDIAVIVEVFQSCREMLGKVLWTLLILLAPVVGIILYFLFAERHRHRYVMIV